MLLLTHHIGIIYKIPICRLSRTTSLYLTQSLTIFLLCKAYSLLLGTVCYYINNIYSAFIKALSIS